MRPPTAVHADGEVHDTEVRNHPPPGGFGVRWMRHVVPFHRSASVPGGISVNGLAWPPTARQDDRDGHDTPVRLPPSAGLGVGWMLQVLPFHRSASVAGDWLLNRFGLE